MEIFKLLESTMANVQPGHSMKHLRRDQLLDNYEAAAKTLQTLMNAKESEIAYRKDLIKMLDDSKNYHDNRLAQAKQEYQMAKSNIPESLNLNSIQIRSKASERSTTPPMPPPASTLGRLPPPLPQAPSHSVPPTTLSSVAPSSYQTPMQPTGGSQMNSSDGQAGDSHDHNRSSLDRRLSEFMKNFPGMAPQAGVDQQHAAAAAVPKPGPGYYTQQPPLSAPMQISAAAPPSMELLRFPPPNMLTQPPPPPPTMAAQSGFQRPYSMQGVQDPNHHHHHHHQENHESADMELSDHEEPASVPPMIAAALQQGAGGRTTVHSDGYNNHATLSQSYAPRINPLPFDPAIMDPGLRSSHSPGGSTSSRDRHGDRSSSSRHRSIGSNQGTSSKSRYSSSSSTSSQSSSSHRDKSRR